MLLEGAGQATVEELSDVFYFQTTLHSELLCPVSALGHRFPEDDLFAGRQPNIDNLLLSVRVVVLYGPETFL